jgi:ABC-type sugar transport system permease subunit
MRLIFAVLITLLSIFYFLPFAIAFNRKRANTGAIFALNLFLGWSLIGWVVALVWALKEERLL